MFYTDKIFGLSICYQNDEEKECAQNFINIVSKLSIQSIFSQAQAHGITLNKKYKLSFLMVHNNIHLRLMDMQEKQMYSVCPAMLIANIDENAFDILKQRIENLSQTGFKQRIFQIQSDLNKLWGKELVIELLKKPPVCQFEQLCKEVKAECLLINAVNELSNIIKSKDFEK